MRRCLQAALLAVLLLFSNTSAIWASHDPVEGGGGLPGTDADRNGDLHSDNRGPDHAHVF